MNSQIRKTLPKPLIPGDTIGIVAPASPFDRDKFHKGIIVLEKMGYKIFIPEGVYKEDMYLAGTDEERSDLLNSLFMDKTIKGIISARGGFGSIRILSSLDYEVIQKNPKIFIGFSDITALLSVLNTRCGLVTFHGPMVTTLGKADSKTRESFLKSITLNQKIKITPTPGDTLKSGSAVGMVAGGNLTTLCHLVGTPFQPCFKNNILILEDIGEAPYKIDRMLIQMKLAGCFEGVAGMALGSFKDCGEADQIYKIFEKIFREDSFPILAGFGIGHGRMNLTFPVGIKATLDADRHLLLYHEPAISAVDD